jgi:prephenate dehydrogenase
VTEGPAAGLGRVAIVGAGQVGTMIGLSLRGAASEIALADRRAGALRDSLARGAGDREVPMEEVSAADVVVLAVPVPEIVRLVGDIAPGMRAGAFLIDTGSAKRTVVEAMRTHARPEVHAIGGHPLAGTEGSGPDAAAPERKGGSSPRRWARDRW